MHLRSTKTTFLHSVKYNRGVMPNKFYAKFNVLRTRLLLLINGDKWSSGNNIFFTTFSMYFYVDDS